jgi:hypothetical protein
MNRFVSILAALVIAVIAVPATLATAQPAAAIGHPLPDGQLPVGTISVRVIAGAPSIPVTGADVSLFVNKEPRQARTDAAGRATFAGLPPGAMVQAQIKDADGKEINSDEFPVPDEGGARLMLSTKPFGGSGGGGGGGMMPGAEAGGPMMGGAGMPEARAMSGQPRPERTDPVGAYTVRLTYNDLKMANGKLTDPQPPVGTPISLVAYAADDSIKVVTLKAGADGHVTFDGLDQTGGTSYFVLATLPRNGASDKLIAVPAVLDAQSGVRCVLSAEKRDSTAPPVDDYTKLVPQDGSATPAGKVRVTLDGVPVEASAKITLYDAATMKPIGIQSPHEGPPDPSQVRAGADFNQMKDYPAGTFEAEVTGGPGQTQNPMPGITVQLVGEGDKAIEGGAATTGMDGKAKLTIKPANGVKAVLVINGKQMGSAPMDLVLTGGKLVVTANWAERGKPEATFDVAPTAGQVLFAETVMNRQLFRSLPFQMAPDTGTHASVYVYPRTLFTFSVHSFIEDQLLAVQGNFEITNYAWAPYRSPGTEGLVIKLPPGHKGGIIAPQDQGDVSVADREGFRLMRPIPPGGRKFRAGFSLPVVDGQVEWKLDLPMGTWQSGMEIRQNDGMTVKLPTGVTGETRQASTGEPWFVIDNITIERGQSMVMTIAGLPAEEKWKIWVPRVVGVLVLLTLLAGIGYALTRSAPIAKPDHEARRAKLLDELVDLDRDGKQDTRRRAQILDELERLWGA